MPFGTPFNNIMPLFLQGPVGTGLPLTVVAPNPISGVATLFTQGPASSGMPLFMGENIDASGEFSLYVQSPWATGDPPHVLEQALAPLAVSGTTYFNTNSTTTLSIDAPTTGSGIGISTLFVEVDPPSADGTVPVSGLITMSVEGNDPAGTGEGRNEQTTLFVRVQDVKTSGLPIYLERPVGVTMPLSITSLISSGVLPVSISGVTVQTGSTTLHLMSPPPSGLLNIEISGYSE